MENRIFRVKANIQFIDISISNHFCLLKKSIISKYKKFISPYSFILFLLPNHSNRYPLKQFIKNSLISNIKSTYSNERGIALILLKPIEPNKETNSERVGKFMIESAKYS